MITVYSRSSTLDIYLLSFYTVALTNSNYNVMHSEHVQSTYFDFGSI